ncbi:hypothetical protein PHAVU_009G215900 [Phaseolus vulgaris]|uniref:Reverse transcriptase RNase H-like domain-containing protein n=1 Tax=Phaseolus vulgaris TaxID=3885 RepID=V7B234_PHAVU|nr:hypothetical protein PHAVU_009G215900g [Phaseolus vulgaris]ESW10511.1 hypothetical protein PHAVU_009G215900g [Phaseolus vulgaris]
MRIHRHVRVFPLVLIKWITENKLNILCLQKFQDDLFNKRFLIRTDCKATPSVLTKDVQNLLYYPVFDFEIEHIKEKDNSLTPIPTDSPKSIPLDEYLEKLEINIQFSKIKILQVLTPQEWNQPLHNKNSLSRKFDPQQYSYYDYMDAWINGISLKFPRWFIKWFVDFGPLPSIFPTEINEVYSYFQQNYTFVPGYRLISFITSQAITWIVV